MISVGRCMYRLMWRLVAGFILQSLPGFNCMKYPPIKRTLSGTNITVFEFVASAYQRHKNNWVNSLVVVIQGSIIRKHSTATCSPSRAFTAWRKSHPLARRDHFPPLLWLLGTWHHLFLVFSNYGLVGLGDDEWDRFADQSEAKLQCIEAIPIDT